MKVEREAKHPREQRPRHGQRPVKRSTDDRVTTHDDIQTEVIRNDHGCGGRGRHCRCNCAEIDRKEKLHH